ncbi:MAG TPA: carboxymuconolactone decarboxylase family protein [Gammaproteobacteria bacterium]|nr:carboxymuconolactone decarboxylase family protein [Gammaproteobacteria bacterium]
MPRLKQVPRSEATPEMLEIYDHYFGDRDPVAEPGTPTGTPGHWWTVTAVAPEIFNHILAGMVLHSSPDRKLDEQLRELGMTRAGYLVGSKFVFSQHCKVARHVGLSEEKVSALPAWSLATCYSPIERAVLAYTDELVLSRGRVSDVTFDSLRESLSDEEIMEFTYVTLTYTMHATISRAFRLEYDDIDEHVVEIPSPTGQDSENVMQGVNE